jgi:hypothetical protein
VVGNEKAGDPWICKGAVQAAVQDAEILRTWGAAVLRPYGIGMGVAGARIEKARGLGDDRGYRVAVIGFA